MSGPSVRFRLPPLSFFKFPPDNEPQTLPPPRSTSRFAVPFTIDESIYNAVLEPSVPITIAAVYCVTVLYLNRQNRKSGGKPWKISQTRSFFTFVLSHNILLALYSAATCAGMLRALRHCWPSVREHEWLGILWPGLRTQNSLAGAVDALCKLHGPRGFGDAASYSVTKGVWEVKNKLVQFGLDNRPDPTDVGRLWNEGMGFWGWLFYLSKFYEVLDTLIILMKGKNSSTLQVYHHMGAMLAMWAGIRYMSPPIWMFVFVNSGIHTLMYVYYTLSALNIRVPRLVKKTLTTMQIAQFFIGFTFATLHLFIEYDVPVSTIYAGKQGFKAATSTLAAAFSTLSSEAVAATASAGIDAWIKKLVYRAAGQEGLAENVRNQHGDVFGPEADLVREHLDRARWGNLPRYEAVTCLNTSGQAFATWFNLIYLAPLTWLFLRFFVRQYQRPSSQKGTATNREQISKAAKEAARDTKQKTEEFGRSAENGLDKAVSKTKQAADEKVKTSQALDKTADNFVKETNSAVESAKSQAKKAKSQAQKTGQDAIKAAKYASEQASEKIRATKNEANSGKTAQASINRTQGSPDKPALKGETTSSSQDSTVLVEKEDAFEKPNGQPVFASQAAHTNGQAGEATTNGKQNNEPQGLSTNNSKAAGSPSYADKVK